MTQVKRTAHPPYGRVCCCLLLWVLLATLLGGCLSSESANSHESVVASEASQALGESGATPMRCLYYERELFLSAMSSPRLYESRGRLVAGLIPHHLLASDMIAGFFSMAAREPEGYDTVLLVSPSHFPENCGSDVVTSSSGWDTPYGPASADSATIEALLRNPAIAAEDNPAAVETDHGVAGLVPFVKYYLPNAKIATCLLSNKLDRNRLATVRAEIAEICANGRILLVASADCSHYLSPEKAAVRDAQTAAAIEAMDFQRILGFGDSNVDSPQTLTTFLETARSRGAALEQLDHSSSGEKLPHAISNPIYVEGVTTYFVYAAWNDWERGKS